MSCHGESWPRSAGTARASSSHGGYPRTCNVVARLLFPARFLLFSMRFFLHRIGTALACDFPVPGLGCLEFAVETAGEDVNRAAVGVVGGGGEQTRIRAQPPVLLNDREVI